MREGAHHTYTHTYSYTCAHVHIQTQTGRQAGRQTDTHTHRHTPTTTTDAHTFVTCAFRIAEFERLCVGCVEWKGLVSVGGCGWVGRCVDVH